MVSNKEKEKIRKQLRSHSTSKCHYCGIAEKDFIQLWGEFYNGKRGKRLEVDRIDNTKPYSFDNCVLACALCNCAKSDKLSYKEAKKMGSLFRKFWNQRKYQ